MFWSFKALLRWQMTKPNLTAGTSCVSMRTAHLARSSSRGKMRFRVPPKWPVVRSGVWLCGGASARSTIVTKDTIEQMKWTNEIWHQFRNFLPFSAFFGHFLWETRDISSFSENIREILTKFHQNFAEKWPNSLTKIGMKWNFISFRPKSLTVFCWNFEVLAVRRQRNLVELEKSWKMRLFSLS